MKILLLISESWNDSVHPNNNMSNWFTDFPDAEIYTIQCGPEKPENRCCKNYFTVCDAEMVKSFLPGKRAGKILRYDEYPINEATALSNIENRVYSNRNKLHNGFARLLRSAIWRFGRYNKKLMKQFINDCQPDIVFTQRMGSVKMCRLEKIVQSLCNAPMVAYTGDNEYAVGLSTKDLFEKINRGWTRKWLDKMIPTYKLYYSMSEEQMKLYQEKFGVKTKFLVKCGDFREERVHTTINHPIQLVYAGKLYFGRSKTLGLISNVIKEINAKLSSLVFQLHIYTGDILETSDEGVLNNGVSSFVHGAVPGTELAEIYDHSDVVLHVEGLDDTNAVFTKYSFSTKIMDCLSCGAAMVAVCHPSQAGYSYLRKNDVALCASSRSALEQIFAEVAKAPQMLTDYAYKAYLFGSKNHDMKYIQKQILRDFRDVIDESSRN